VVRLPRALAERIVEHARAELPNEACGLLGGRGQEVRTVHPARNADASPYRFTLDPQDQLRITFAVEDEGDEVLGVYHSHTRSKAYPSRTDVESAELLGDTAFVIVSLASEPPDIRAYRLDGGITALDLVVE
jgi:proteasome lid subunit RPN8/RPN11